MQKARRHPTNGLRPLVSARFQVLFHSSIRSAFHLSLTVLVHYRSLRSIQPYRMVPAGSHRISRVPRYSGYCQIYNRYVYGTITLFDKTFQNSSTCDYILLYSPTTPILPKQYRFGLFPFRSPLLGESLLISFPPGTQMFQFSGFASFRMLMLHINGLPHSDIFGLTVICTYSKLFAACHVLHRL